MIHYFLRWSNFLLTILDVDEVLCPFIIGCWITVFFFPWDWLHFFLSNDFLWIVFPKIFWFPRQFWFYLLPIDSFISLVIYFVSLVIYFASLVIDSLISLVIDSFDYRPINIYLPIISYFDLVEGYLIRTDDYLIRFIVSCWFWQNVFWRSLYN
jgi:hypothetical protein